MDTLLKRFDETDYYVDYYGNIYSTKRGKLKMLKNRIQSEGYSQASISVGGKIKTILVHRLVAMLFIPNEEPNKIYINHKDGNKQNNHYENLEWCSGSHNAKHALETGLRIAGKKLTPENILEIRKSDKKTKELSLIYNITRATIYRIKNKKIWKKI